jgi:hypothetical protein
MNFRHSIIFALITLFVGASAPVLVSAQSGTFVVRPAKVELSGAPGETVRASISLENQLGAPATFSVSFEDVVGSDDPNDPVTLLGGERGPYPLKDLLRGAKTVSLESGEEKRFPVSITIPADASPGGLYGSVIFTPQRTRGDGNVIPDSRIGVLLFLRVTGEVKEEGSLKDISYEGGRVVFGKPESTTQMRLLFENLGTVHLSPYGVITIAPLLGEVSEIDVDPWYVLPKSTRSRSLEVGQALSYGPNTLTLSLNRGYADASDLRSITVWVLPSLRTIGIVLAILIVILLAILRRGRSLHV